MVESIEPLERRFDGNVGSGPDDGPQVGVQVEGPDVVHADRLSTGLDVLDRDGADIVLLDLNLPDSRGLDTLDAVLEAAPESPVVVLTGSAMSGDRKEASRFEATKYVVKPLAPDGFPTLVEDIRKHWMRIQKESVPKG